MIRETVEDSFAEIKKGVHFLIWTQSIQQKELKRTWTYCSETSDHSEEKKPPVRLLEKGGMFAAEAGVPGHPSGL